MMILEHTQTIHNIALTPDFEHSGVAFAASQNGVIITRDGGETWQQIGKSVPVTAILATENMLITSAVGQIFVSDDLGETWLATALPVPTTIVSTLAAHGEILLAATLDDGVLCSNDGGKTWRGWNFGLLDWRVLALAMGADGTAYAGTETGLVRSGNSGRSWQELFVPQDGAITAIFEADGEILAGTEKGEVLSSNDGGKTWTTLKNFDQPINAIAINAEKNVAVLHGDRLSLHMGKWYDVGLFEVSAMTRASPKSLLIAYHDGQICLKHVDALLSAP